MLRELVRVRRRDLELLGALRDLVFQRALVIGDLRLRFGEALRHLVERVREQAQLVRRARRNVHVELARADGTRRAHQAPHRRNQSARQQQRGEDRQQHDGGQDRQRAGQLTPELLLLAREGHAHAHEADRGVRCCERGRAVGVLRLRCGRRRLAAEHGRRDLDVARAVDDVAQRRGCGRGDTAGQRRHVDALQCLGVPSPGHDLPVGVEDDDVGDVAVAAQAFEHAGEIGAIGRRRAPLRKLGHHRRDRGGLAPQLLVAVIPLLPKIEARRHHGREHDQADGEHVELGQQSHPDRRQIGRMVGLAGERGQVPAKAAHRVDHGATPRRQRTKARVRTSTCVRTPLAPLRLAWPRASMRRHGGRAHGSLPCRVAMNARASCSSGGESSLRLEASQGGALVVYCGARGGSQRAACFGRVIGDVLCTPRCSNVRTRVRL